MLYCRTFSWIGVGKLDKKNYLNQKCKSLEYSLNARSFTLGFDELLDIREKVFHYFCKVYLSEDTRVFVRHNRS